MISSGDIFPWNELTRSPDKEHAYGRDLYFREGWDDLTCDPSVQVDQVLRRTALLSLKPDALAARRGGQVLDFLAHHRFDVVDAWDVSLDRHGQRAMWHFDWHVYPPDRLEFSTFWYSTCPLFVIAVADPQAAERGSVPASVRLSTLKGSADPTARTPEHLRSVLATPNRILNFVHVTDEPADLVRELAIYWPVPGRREVASALSTGLAGQGGGVAVRGKLARSEARVCHHDLDVRESVKRLEAGGHAPDGLRDVVETAGLAPREMLSDVLTSGGDRWDVITVASAIVEYERPGFTGLLPGPDVAGWSRPS